MTSLNTLPITHIVTPAKTHEHAWLVESRHPTSEGIVLYVRCGDCGTRRIDLQTNPHMPPTAASTERPSATTGDEQRHLDSIQPLNRSGR